MKLSYSTIQATINCRQYFLNKQMDIPKLDFWYFEKGKQVHKKIQDHLSGRNIDQGLTERGLDPNKWYFPIVEEKDRDPDCHFEIDIDGHTIEGYFDARNPGKMLGEIKSGSYSPRDYYKSNQRKLYYLALGDPVSVLINARDEFSKITTTTITNSEKDRQDALAFVRKGIEIVTGADFEGGEKIDCHRCIYKDSCEKSNVRSKSRRDNKEKEVEYDNDKQ